MERAEEFTHYFQTYNNTSQTESHSPLSPLVRRVKGALPEWLKIIARKIIYQKRGKYPLQTPFLLEIEGIQAHFWVRNHSDWYRIVAHPETFYLSEILKTVLGFENPIFVDIGAAQGVHSILAARAGASVYAFDPDPISIESFKDNLAFNPEMNERIIFYPWAIGDSNQRTSFFIDRRGTYAPSLKPTRKILKERIEVEVYSLDYLISQGIIPPPQIVKIDVEGAERNVLKGMQATLPLVSHLFIEVHLGYLSLFGASFEEVFQIINQAGLNGLTAWQREQELLCHFCR